MAADHQETFNLKARDDRFFRAAESVLRNYEITRRQQLVDGLAVFDISGGSRDYVVKVHPLWQTSPQCSCPDAAQRARESTRGYCKHIIAVLLSNQDLSCQLLEIFL